MCCHSFHLRNISQNHSSLMAKSGPEVDLDDWEFLPDNKTFLDLSLGTQNDAVLIKEMAVDVNYFVCPSRSLVAEEEEEEAPESELGYDSAEEMNTGEAAGGLEIKDIGVVAVHPEPEQQLQEESLVLLEDGTEKDKDRGAGSREVKVRDGFGLTVLNWRLTGIGALCSMGAAAAASICILIVGGRQHQKQQRPEQKIHLKMYADEKRMKEMVEQATRLNQALTAVRGVPMTRARISFGGYCASV